MPQVNFPEAFHKALLLMPEREGGSLVWDLQSRKEAYGAKMKIYKFLARAREGLYGAQKQEIAQSVTVRTLSTIHSGEKDTLVEWVYGKDASFDAVMGKALAKDAGGATKTERWNAYVVEVWTKRMSVQKTPEIEAEWTRIDREKAAEIGVDFSTGEPL